MAIAAAAIPAAIGFTGQQFTNRSNAKEAQRNRQFQAAEAEKARKYTTEMSNTSYQRAVKDLQAAGLNPALAYQQGGSSTPNSPTSSGSTAEFRSAAGAGLSSAADFSRLREERKTAEVNRGVMQTQGAKNVAETQKTEAETQTTNLLREHMVEKMKGETRNAIAQAALAGTKNMDIWESFGRRMQFLEAETESVMASAAEARARTHLHRLEVPHATAEARKSSTWYGRNISPYLSDVGKLVGIGTSISSAAAANSLRQYAAQRVSRGARK